MKMERRDVGRIGRVMTLLVAVSIVAISCGGEKTPETAAMLYDVQGTIQQLPDPSTPGSELQISHEAIPTFVSSEGKVVGMNAMTMPFPVKKDLSLDGLQVGDAVAFSLEVQWDRSPAFLVTRLERIEMPAADIAEPETPSATDTDAESSESAENATEEEHHEH